MYDTMTHDEVMELEPGDMIRVKVFYPNELVTKRVAFVDSQKDGVVHYHLWMGTKGVAVHGDLYAASEAV